jgi:hypothetical protein
LCVSKCQAKLKKGKNAASVCIKKISAFRILTKRNTAETDGREINKVKAGGGVPGGRLFY